MANNKFVTAQQLNSSTAQQLNSSTAQQLNSSTAQQLNSSTAQQLNSSTAQRHCGIDLLRIVSMLMVCVLHVNIFGRYDEISRQEQPWEWLSWGGTESLCVIAVNLYAMTTGYVCITSSWRISRYIALWLQVAFYTVGIYALGFFLAYMGWIPKPWFKGIFSAVFPIPMVGIYWYFNAYTALFLLMPFLNKLLQKLSQADYAKLLAVLLIFLPLMITYGGGYNAGWLGVLYCAGAFLRLHPLHVRKPSLCFLIYLLGATGYFLLLSHRLHGIRDVLLSMGYASPFSIISTLSLFLVFKGLDIKTQRLKTVIRFVAPLTFGVYLVHCHPVVSHFLRRWGDQFITEYGHPVWMPLVGSLCLFIVCATVDWLRLHIFRWCHTKMLADKLERGVMSLWSLAKERGLRVTSDEPRRP